MGIIHLSDRKRDMVFIVWDGQVTWEDWKAHAQALTTDPNWHVISRFMADVQTVSDTSTIGEGELEQAVAILHSNPDTLIRKRSAVVASEEFWRASKFREILSQTGIESVVFNNLDTACLFLGINLAETHQTMQELRAQLRSVRATG